MTELAFIEPPAATSAEADHIHRHLDCLTGHR